MVRQAEAFVDVSAAEPAAAAPVRRSVTLPWRVPVSRLVSWAGWLVPIGVGVRYVGLATLDVRHGQDLLIGDYTTYVAAPNFLRSTPWLGFPVGKLPDYLAPIGTSLGQTDASPALTPVYRLLLAIFPSSPIQLVGPLLFASLLAMFAVLRHHTRRCLAARTTLSPGWLVELCAVLFAGVLLTQPFFLSRMGHVALMQQWILVLAIVIALAEASRPVTAVVPLRLAIVVVVAAAVEPYLVAMVLPIAVAPLLRKAPSVEWSSWLGRLVGRAAALGALTVAVSFVLGYIGGGRVGNEGFGTYSANALFLIDPSGFSRLLGDLPYPGSGEGYGYVGIAVLVLGVGVVVVSWRRRTSGRHPGAGWRWPIVMVCTAMATYAMLPVVWVGNTELVDARPTTDHLSLLVDTLRTNGRFVWPLTWLIGLAVVGALLRVLDLRVAAVVGVAALSLQLVEVIPSRHTASNPAYDTVRAMLERAHTAGATSVQVQPPLVAYECFPDEWPSFDALRNVVLSSAVVGMSINSGYAGRGDERWNTTICQDQAQAFLAGEYRDDVLYVIPAVRYSDELALRCLPLPEEQYGCMTENVRGWR